MPQIGARSGVFVYHKWFIYMRIDVPDQYYNPRTQKYESSSPLKPPPPDVNIAITVGWVLRCGDDGPEKSGT